MNANAVRTGHPDVQFLVRKSNPSELRVLLKNATSGLGGVSVGSLDVDGHDGMANGDLYAVITELEVPDFARGYGVGTRLLEMALEWARDNGYKGLTATAGFGGQPRREPGPAFLEAAGFRAREPITYDLEL